MAFPNAIEGGWKWDETYKAENDLTAKQFYAVERSTVDYVDVCDAATDIAIGVLQNDPDQYEPAQVRLMGLTQMVVAGNSVNIAIGDSITIDTSGRGVKATSGDRCIGRAEEAATADNVRITVRLAGEYYEP
jgi:hypothetical protein